MSRPDNAEVVELAGWKHVALGAIPFFGWIVAASIAWKMWGLIGAVLMILVGFLGLKILEARTDWDQVREQGED